MKIIGSKEGICLVAGKDYNEGELVIQQTEQSIYIEKAEKLKDPMQSKAEMKKSIVFQFCHNLVGIPNTKVEE